MTFCSVRLAYEFEDLSHINQTINIYFFSQTASLLLVFYVDAEKVTYSVYLLSWVLAFNHFLMANSKAGWVEMI